MATNKNAQLRYKILDECFANIDERYYIEDLIYTCEEKLSQKGKKESISKRTILDDIKFMKSREGYNAPIESIKDEKDKRKKYIKLSERGIEYLESHKKAYEVWFKSMWDKFDAREKEAFNILLTKTNLVLREEIQDKEDNNETN